MSTSIEMKDKVQAQARFMEEAIKATCGEQWLAAVWCVKDKKVEMVSVTTWKFQTGDFKTVVEQLNNYLEAEKVKSDKAAATANPPTPDVLPIADFIKQMQEQMKSKDVSQGVSEAKKPEAPANVEVCDGSPKAEKLTLSKIPFRKPCDGDCSEPNKSEEGQ